MNTVLWCIGLGLVVASFGLRLVKPRQNRRPRITVNTELPVGEQS
jgi:hypothetical protein